MGAIFVSSVLVRSRNIFSLVKSAIKLLVNVMTLLAYTKLCEILMVRLQGSFTESRVLWRVRWTGYFKLSCHRSCNPNLEKHEWWLVYFELILNGISNSRHSKIERLCDKMWEFKWFLLRQQAKGFYRLESRFYLTFVLIVWPNMFQIMIHYYQLLLFYLQNSEQLLTWLL